MTDERYDVGYGKPPVGQRFEKGRSGNPKGRPKGRKSVSALIDSALHKTVKIREGGKVRTVSQVEALIRRVVQDGLKGDGKATDQAIKLVQLRGALTEQGAEGDDGSATDVEADQAALS